MDYNKNIIRKFTEMPVWDDSNLDLDDPHPKSHEVNSKRFNSISRQDTLMKKKELINGMSVEVYQNRVKTNSSTFLIKTENNQRILCGELDAHIHGDYPFPSIIMSYILKNYQGKGFAKEMYNSAIDAFGGLVSDEKLTGEKIHGAFDIWTSLAKLYYSYLIEPTMNGLDVKEVGMFDKNMMGDTNVRFMVSIDEYETNDF